MNKASNWIPICAVGLAGFIFLWLLGNVLIPFVIAAYLSYLGNPFVHTLMNHGLPRTWAVIVVFVIIILILIGLWLLLIPLIKNQIALFLIQLPSIILWFQSMIQPLLQKFSIFSDNISLLAFKDNFLQYLPQTQNVAGEILGTLKKSGGTILGILLNILLVPVVTFYFLRDWDNIFKKQPYWLNFPSASKWIVYWREVDQVLKGFLRGQLSVMLILGFSYSLALDFLGVPLSFLIGMSAGLLSLVPFLGFITGILLASLMAILQFHDLLHIIYVFAIFLGFSLIENIVLVPLLLGESLGLHPIVVIFSVLAGGELFGILGVLLALPSAAIIKVSLRHFLIHLKENPNRFLQSL